MSVRKLAGLAAAFALAVGLIGGGVSAAFSSQVSAVQNIKVGTFGCQISAASAGVIASDKLSVTYDAPDIMSSVPSSAPFSFTVANTGTIPAVLTLSATTVALPFSDILGAQADRSVGAGANTVYDAGLSWAELGMGDLDKTVSITYTVSCQG